MADEHQRAVVARRATRRGSPSTRGRGGWSARPSAAGCRALISSRASATRARSPPDSTLTCLSTSSPREHERAEHRAHARRRRVGRRALHDLVDRRRQVERVGVVLRVVADLDAVADLDRAAVVRQLAGDHAQQRGLARAVDADDADLLAAPARSGRRRGTRRARRTPSSGPRRASTSATVRVGRREREPHRPCASRRSRPSPSSRAS